MLSSQNNVLLSFFIETAFNRTILELKSRIENAYNNDKHPFNRTILELKYSRHILKKTIQKPF